MINVPKTKSYVRNAQRARQDSVCVVCGRGLQDPQAQPWLRTWFGSQAVTGNEALVLEVTDPMGDSGCFPLGKDCLRHHPELVPYVMVEPVITIPDEYKEAWRWACRLHKALKVDAPVWHPLEKYEDPFIEIASMVFVEHTDVDVDRPETLNTLPGKVTIRGWYVYTVRHYPGTRWDPPDSEPVDQGNYRHAVEAIRRAHEVYFDEVLDAAIVHYSEMDMEAEIARAEEQAEKGGGWTGGFMADWGEPVPGGHDEAP